MKKQLLLIFSIIWLTWGPLSACGPQNRAAVRPVEQEQIKNVVREYVVRDTNIPDYEVTIEAVAEDWARVSLAPAQVEGQTTTLYLQKQDAGQAAPTAIIAELPGHEARTQATTGWTIILGPQADFSPAELNEVAVPSEVRP
ncbi:MAG: hypothetical protein KDF65_01770 [Anaerolineae bacterium]|nr:hypothetical protein [Anaerolineae bacterium]